MPEFRRTQPPPEGTGDDRLTTNPDDCVTHAKLDRRLESGRAFMLTHIDAKFDHLENLIKSGFPNGDPRKHCEVHEGFIRAAADNHALWKSVREKTVSGAIWSALGLLILAVWEAIKVGVHK